MRSPRYSIVLVLVGVVLLTQRWHGWEEALELGGNDTASYEQIAFAAPALPATLMPFHHAQRLAGPYLIGLGAIASGVDVRDLFRAATGVCLLLAILFLGAALSRLGIANWEFAFCMTLFITHFTLRFYLIAPGMLPDAVFIFGIAATLYGLAGRNLAIVVAGALVAAAGRQTALLMIPGVALWMAFGEGWAGRPAASRQIGIAVVATTVVVVYLASALLATAFGLPSENIGHLTGLVDWLRSPGFSLEGLAIFLAYAIVPLVLALTIIAAALPRAWERGQPVELWACLLMAAAIACQPFLGGPQVTDANAVRLCALGLAPLVVSAALVLGQAGYPKERWKYRGPLVVGALIAASFHYNYTNIGPASKFEFGAIHFAIALLVGYLVYGKRTLETGADVASASV